MFSNEKTSKLDVSILYEVKYPNTEPWGFRRRTEDCIVPMIRKGIAALAALLLLAVLFGIAGAEDLPGTEGLPGKDPATPTDLSCLHEHTVTKIYFYDAPVYTTLNAESHRVYGAAEIRTLCEDCGEILAIEVQTDAEEVRPHTIKKGVCVLCGYREPVRETKAPEKPRDLPGEQTLIAKPETEKGDLLTLTLTPEELSALAEAGISTALVKGEPGAVGIAVSVTDMLRQTKEAEAKLYMELAERPDESFFASVSLIGRDGEKTEPQGVAIRFFLDSPADVRITLAPSDKDTLVETKGSWDEHGYWSVPYVEEGTYFLLR